MPKPKTPELPPLPTLTPEAAARLVVVYAMSAGPAAVAAMIAASGQAGPEIAIERLSAHVKTLRIASTAARRLGQWALDCPTKCLPVEDRRAAQHAIATLSEIDRDLAAILDGRPPTQEAPHGNN